MSGACGPAGDPSIYRAMRNHPQALAALVEFVTVVYMRNVMTAHPASPGVSEPVHIASDAQGRQAPGSRNAGRRTTARSCSLLVLGWV